MVGADFGGGPWREQRDGVFLFSFWLKKRTPWELVVLVFFCLGGTSLKPTPMSRRRKPCHADDRAHKSNLRGQRSAEDENEEAGCDDGMDDCFRRVSVRRATSGGLADGRVWVDAVLRSVDRALFVRGAGVVLHQIRHRQKRWEMVPSEIPPSVRIH
ncbi:hypothetical protein LY76DRAFT_14363 [Colletotrichum caudatum]|nr:hypothetical protein LY76DRAFT_14363 [Colletotrichum caudatum]